MNNAKNLLSITLDFFKIKMNSIKFPEIKESNTDVLKALGDEKLIDNFKRLVPEDSWVVMGNIGVAYNFLRTQSDRDTFYSNIPADNVFARKIDRFKIYLYTLCVFNHLDEDKFVDICKKIDNFPDDTNNSHNHDKLDLFINTIKKMPYGFTYPNVELQKVKQVLDNEIYGMEQVKREVLRTIASETYLNNKGENRCSANNNLLLIGKPGVGKTKIASAISKALDREMVFISFSSRKDSTFLYGMNSSWADAKPGLLVSGLAGCKAENPVFVLDEIDKSGADRGGSLINSLVPLLDPNQNTKIVDEYLTVEMDFSKVFYIATANDKSLIPDYILDRFNVIEIPDYDVKSKVTIIRKYIKKEIQDKTAITLSIETKAAKQLAEKVDSLREIKRIITGCSQDKLLKRTLSNPKISDFNCKITSSDLKDIPLSRSEPVKRPVGFLR